MPALNRRDFLAHVSVAVAGAALGGRNVFAQRTAITSATAVLPPISLLPEPMTPASLRAFAAHALNAARGAGAVHADVRVCEQIRMRVDGGDAAIIGQFSLSPAFSYGIRVAVGGATAFVHGVTPSADAVAAAARNAVATARGYAAFGEGRTVWTPGPAVSGEWTTPIQLDPFMVPLGDHAALLSSLFMAATRVRNVGSDLPSATVNWTRETRVYASTSGSQVTQTFYQYEPEIFEFKAGYPMIEGRIAFRPVPARSGGYECLTAPDLQDRIKQQADDAARLLTLPHRPLDVGRYPMVVDGTMVGSLAARTLGRALEGDRVLGYEIGASGGSYLAPPEDVMGTDIASHLLTMTAGRPAPSITAAKWDDDGTETREIPLISNGRLVNYLASRQMATALRGSTRSADALPGLPGCVTAPDGDNIPLIRTPHLAIAPSPSSATLDDLCRGVKKGVLLLYKGYVSTDNTVASGFVLYPGALLEIDRGTVVRRLRGNGVQFATRRVWQALGALGDATTLAQNAGKMDKGQPSQFGAYSSSAPAALFKEVDVINTEIQI